MDKKLRELLSSANIDLEIIKVLILRTTYPWSGEIKKQLKQKSRNVLKNQKKLETV